MSDLRGQAASSDLLQTLEDDLPVLAGPLRGIVAVAALDEANATSQNNVAEPQTPQRTVRGSLGRSLLQEVNDNIQTPEGERRQA